MTEYKTQHGGAIDTLIRLSLLRSKLSRLYHAELYFANVKRIFDKSKL
uniref:Uncharacterized protein n=1 Tax=Siphoviridae sp. ctYOF2 TaxID=2826376 RepID=A0A8S5MA51_9CAUD|nr:MAG TPA: hypothetical protein [Siphoviridae sp. ctYOF2]